jgi:hypothetical protein
MEMNIKKCRLWAGVSSPHKGGVTCGVHIENENEDGDEFEYENSLFKLWLDQLPYIMENHDDELDYTESDAADEMIRGLRDVIDQLGSFKQWAKIKRDIPC